MANLFEELWNDAENSLQEETNLSSFKEIVKEAMIKLSTLEALDNISNMPQEDLVRLKANAIGKLMLVFTQLTAKEGINVYAALKAALDDRKILILEEKYK